MIVKCRECEQRDRCILSKLEREELSEVERMLSKSSYRRGGLIFQQGLPISGCYIVCQGAVKLVRRTRRGEKQILRILRPGDLIEVEALYEKSHSTYAKALEGAQVAFITQQDFKRLLEKYPALAQEVLNRLAQESLYFQEECVKRAHRGIKERLSLLLEELGVKFGTEGEHGLIIGLKLRKRELAELLGCSSVSLYKALHDLEGRGIISYEGRKIVIKDAESLHRIGE